MNSKRLNKTTAAVLGGAMIVAGASTLIYGAVAHASTPENTPSPAGVNATVDSTLSGSLDAFSSGKLSLTGVSFTKDGAKLSLDDIKALSPTDDTPVNIVASLSFTVKGDIAKGDSFVVGNGVVGGDAKASVSINGSAADENNMVHIKADGKGNHIVTFDQDVTYSGDTVVTIEVTSTLHSAKDVKDFFFKDVNGNSVLTKAGDEDQTDGNGDSGDNTEDKDNPNTGDGGSDTGEGGDTTEPGGETGGDSEEEGKDTTPDGNTDGDSEEEGEDTTPGDSDNTPGGNTGGGSNIDWDSLFPDSNGNPPISNVDGPRSPSTGSSPSNQVTNVSEQRDSGGYTDDSKAHNPSWIRSDGGESVSVSEEDDIAGPEVKTGGETEKGSFFSKVLSLLK